jgi:cell division protein FtsI/penicillin-binding protein 2
MVSPAVSEKLLEMLQTTTVTGTARKEFRKFRVPEGVSRTLASKTGTLRGSNPKGTYFWFVAASPAENPEVVIATLVVDQGKSWIRASALSRLMLQKYYALKDVG